MGKKRRSRAFKENDQVINIEEERLKRREKRKQQAEKKKGREPESPVSQRRTQKQRRRRVVYGAIALFVVCIVGFSVYNVITLRMERAEAAADYKALQKEQEKLEKELSQVDTDEYIENKARSELRMTKPGEKLLILPQTDAEGTVTSGAAAGSDGAEGEDVLQPADQ